MNSVCYKIIGRSGAGSLIAEFLLAEIGVNYEIIFTEPKDIITDDSASAHPQGKIPTLICPDEKPIFETLAKPFPPPKGIVVFSLQKTWHPDI